MDARRSAIAIIVLVLVVWFVVIARGREHRRGDEVGAMRSAPVAAIEVG